MIAIVQEGIEKYKAALRIQNKQHVEMMRACNTRQSKGDWTLPVGFYEIDQRGRELKGMAEVLGLSKEEKAAIDKECGVSTMELNTVD